MPSWISIPLGLFVAGALFGLLRNRRAPRQPTTAKRSKVGWIVAGLLCGSPLVLLMLAKVSGSDALGWMFGLTLMAGMALLPCLVIIGIGVLVGSKFNRRLGVPAAAWVEGASSSTSAAQSAEFGTGALLAVRVDRDSVHAGDDTEAHVQTFMVEPGSTLAAFLHQLRRARYFASIAGGEATWIVESAQHPGQALGVCAQQWPEARLTPAADTTLARLFGNVSASLHFRYWCQVDPERVYAAVATGQELPPRY